MGALGFQFVSPEAARAWVNEYYTNLTQHLAKLADYPANPNIAMVTAFMCAPTDEEAQAKAAGWTFFVFCLSHYGRHGMASPGQGNMWELYQEWRHTPKAQETLTGRTDRLAGDDPAEAPRVRGDERRPGHPARTRRGARRTRTSARASSCSRAR